MVVKHVCMDTLQHMVIFNMGVVELNLTSGVLWSAE